MSNSNTPTPTAAQPANPAKPANATDGATASDVPSGGTPLQPPESADESALESIGKAISAPVRDAAEDEERKQVGQPRSGS